MSSAGWKAYGAGGRRAITRIDYFAPELAWTVTNHAAMLLESGTRQERMQAAVLLDDGQHAATTLGLARLAENAPRVRLVQNSMRTPN